MQGTMPVALRRERSRTTWMDNINTWTGLPVEESTRMTEDRDKWKKSTSMMWPTLGSITAKEQDRTSDSVRCSQCRPMFRPDNKKDRPTCLFTRIFCSPVIYYRNNLRITQSKYEILV